MYNPQAYSATVQQPMYDSSGAAVMGGNPEGGMAMAMASQHDAVTGHQHQYQTPYTSAPYGVSIPTASSNLPAHYFPASSPGNVAPRPSMSQQPMSQRIQPPSAPNRAFPYGNMQPTPPHVAGSHPQFVPTQGQSAIQPLQQQGGHPQVGGTVTTPLTPVFPPSQQGQAGQGNVQMATPLSPGSESREKERVTLLLEINRVLLMAVIDLQNAQQAEKEKEAAAVQSFTPTEEEDKAEKERAERAEKAKAVSGREYVECMRRLQSNLAYLAAIADRTHKPSSQIPAHPAIMSPPPMVSNQNLADANPPKPASDSEAKKGEGENDQDSKEESKGLGETKEERIETLKEQYKQLQSLFPAADPKKDPPIQRANEVSRQQMQAKAQAQAQAQAAAGQ